MRWLTNQRRNAAIEAENDARRGALARLRQPDRQLTAKLASARQRAERRVVRDEVCPTAPGARLCLTLGFYGSSSYTLTSLKRTLLYGLPCILVLEYVARLRCTSASGVAAVSVVVNAHRMLLPSISPTPTTAAAQDLVYRSDRNVTDQRQAGTAGGVDWEAEDFERRLKEREHLR